MIVSERFVFLHLHKSGGSFVNEMLLRFLPDARQIGYHLPRSMIPAEFASLPALGFVRNPWSYYVSWYAFQQQRPQRNALFRILSQEGQLDFPNTLRRMLSLNEDHALLQSVVDMLPSHYTNRGLNLPSTVLERIAGTQRGFYSFLYRHIHDAPGLQFVGRMERMREELPVMLHSVGQSVGAVMRAYIDDAPARNASEHARYVDYYDTASRELVAQRDAELIDEYGYRFGD